MDLLGGRVEARRQETIQNHQQTNGCANGHTGKTMTEEEYARQATAKIEREDRAETVGDMPDEKFEEMVAGILKEERKKGTPQVMTEAAFEELVRDTANSKRKSRAGSRKDAESFKESVRTAVQNEVWRLTLRFMDPAEIDDLADEFNGRGRYAGKITTWEERAEKMEWLVYERKSERGRIGSRKENEEAFAKMEAEPDGEAKALRTRLRAKGRLWAVLVIAAFAMLCYFFPMLGCAIAAFVVLFWITCNRS